MARANKRDQISMYLMGASLKELQYMEDLIKTQKTIKILRAMSALETESNKVKKWTALNKKLPTDRPVWVQEKAFNELARIKKWHVTK